MDKQGLGGTLAIECNFSHPHILPTKEILFLSTDKRAADFEDAVDAAVLKPLKCSERLTFAPQLTLDRIAEIICLENPLMEKATVLESLQLLTIAIGKCEAWVYPIHQPFVCAREGKSCKALDMVSLLGTNDVSIDRLHSWNFRLSGCGFKIEFAQTRTRKTSVWKFGQFARVDAAGDYGAL